MSITVYSTPSCPWCYRVKEYFKAKHISFEEVDVSIDYARAQEMIAKSGQMGVPVIDINGQIIVGFNQLAIDEALL